MTIKLVFAASQLNIQHYGVRAYTSWLGIVIYSVFERSDMSTHGLLFQWVYTVKIQLGLVQSTSSFFHRNVTCSGQDIAQIFVILALNDNHSLIAEYMIFHTTNLLICFEMLHLHWLSQVLTFLWKTVHSFLKYNKNNSNTNK
jgi:hypothetical protein